MSSNDHTDSHVRRESEEVVNGVAAAVVRENVDPEGLGRVRLAFLWHSRPDDTYWARMAVPMAGRGRGTYFLPEIGDEVLVAFDHGDLRSPYVVGALWSGTDRPPLVNDGRNDVRQIRSRLGHTLTFDDGRRGRVQIELNGGKKVALDDDGITIDDGKGNRLSILSGSSSVLLQSAGTLTLKSPRISIDASGDLDIKSAGALTLRGAIVRIN